MIYYSDERCALLQGDCLELMAKLPDQCVHAIITDPPYGTTACKWDSVIPFEPMWAQLKRLIKPRGAIVLFGKQPFFSALVMSNAAMFRQEIIWEKTNHDNPMNAKKGFLNIIENIAVFYSLPITYNPQGIMEVNKVTRQGRGESLSQRSARPESYIQTYTNYPRNILKFGKDGRQHPTQKPVALMEYLIKTYTNEGETVLDFTMGSGTTGVACMKTGRKFIGIERDEKYFQIAKERIINENNR